MGNIYDKIGGAMAIYYSIGAFILGLAALGGLGVWIYKVLADQNEFVWITPVGLLFLSAGALVFGYIMYRVGDEQMED